MQLDLERRSLITRIIFWLYEWNENELPQGYTELLLDTHQPGSIWVFELS